MTKCPLMRGVRLRKVSVSEGSTVQYSEFISVKTDTFSNYNAAMRYLLLNCYTNQTGDLTHEQIHVGLVLSVNKASYFC